MTSLLRPMFFQIFPNQAAQGAMIVLIRANVKKSVCHRFKWATAWWGERLGPPCWTEGARKSSHWPCDSRDRDTEAVIPNFAQSCIWTDFVINIHLHATYFKESHAPLRSGVVVGNAACLQ